MSASKLLRILETLPANAHCEISDFDTDDQDPIQTKSLIHTNPFLSDEDDNQITFWPNNLQPELEISTFANEFNSNNREDDTFTKTATKTYTDHNHSEECELPELVVCYKESDNNHEWLRGSTTACCSMDEPEEEKLSKDYQITRCVEESISFDFDTEEVIKVGVKNDERIRSVNEGESSFSMGGVISELISCTRPMPFAGGLSARSDSSATSTRSFAFPTLETEYTSSPVRMGKIERKRLQRERRWRKGLLCCKF